MPRIVVTTNPETEDERAVLLSERVIPADLESEHFSACLVERLGWALVDADELERRRRRSARLAERPGAIGQTAD